MSKRLLPSQHEQIADIQLINSYLPMMYQYYQQQPHIPSFANSNWTELFAPTAAEDLCISSLRLKSFHQWFQQLFKHYNNPYHLQQSASSSAAIRPQIFPTSKSTKNSTSKSAPKTPIQLTLSKVLIVHGPSGCAKSAALDLLINTYHFSPHYFSHDLPSVQEQLHLASYQSPSFSRAPISSSSNPNFSPFPTLTRIPTVYSPNIDLAALGLPPQIYTLCQFILSSLSINTSVSRSPYSISATNHHALHNPASHFPSNKSTNTPNPQNSSIPIKHPPLLIVPALSVEEDPQYMPFITSLIQYVANSPLSAPLVVMMTTEYEGDSFSLPLFKSLQTNPAITVLPVSAVTDTNLHKALLAVLAKARSFINALYVNFLTSKLDQLSNITEQLHSVIQNRFDRENEDVQSDDDDNNSTSHDGRIRNQINQPQVEFSRDATKRLIKRQRISESMGNLESNKVQLNTQDTDLGQTNAIGQGEGVSVNSELKTMKKMAIRQLSALKQESFTLQQHISSITPNMFLLPSVFDAAYINQLTSPTSSSPSTSQLTNTQFLPLLTDPAALKAIDHETVSNLVSFAKGDMRFAVFSLQTTYLTFFTKDLFSHRHQELADNNKHGNNDKIRFEEGNGENSQNSTQTTLQAIDTASLFAGRSGDNAVQSQNSRKDETTHKNAKNTQNSSQFELFHHLMTMLLQKYKDPCLSIFHLCGKILNHHRSARLVGEQEADQSGPMQKETRSIKLQEAQRKAKQEISNALMRLDAESTATTTNPQIDDQFVQLSKADAQVVKRASTGSLSSFFASKPPETGVERRSNDDFPQNKANNGKQVEKSAGAKGGKSEKPGLFDPFDFDDPFVDGHAVKRSPTHRSSHSSDSVHSRSDSETTETLPRDATDVANPPEATNTNKGAKEVSEMGNLVPTFPSSSLSSFPHGFTPSSDQILFGQPPVLPFAELLSAAVDNEQIMLNLHHNYLLSLPTFTSAPLNIPSSSPIDNSETDSSSTLNSHQIHSKASQTSQSSQSTSQLSQTNCQNGKKSAQSQMWPRSHFSPCMALLAPKTAPKPAAVCVNGHLTTDSCMTDTSPPPTTLKTTLLSKPDQVLTQTSNNNSPLSNPQNHSNSAPTLAQKAAQRKALQTLSTLPHRTPIALLSHITEGFSLAVFILRSVQICTQSAKLQSTYRSFSGSNTGGEGSGGNGNASAITESSTHANLDILLNTPLLISALTFHNYAFYFPHYISVYAKQSIVKNANSNAQFGPLLNQLDRIRQVKVNLFAAMLLQLPFSQMVLGVNKDVTESETSKSILLQQFDTIAYMIRNKLHSIITPFNSKQMTLVKRQLMKAKNEQQQQQHQETFLQPQQQQQQSQSQKLHSQSQPPQSQSQQLQLNHQNSTLYENKENNQLNTLLELTTPLIFTAPVIDFPTVPAATLVLTPSQQDFSLSSQQHPQLDSSSLSLLPSITPYLPPFLSHASTQLDLFSFLPSLMQSHVEAADSLDRPPVKLTRFYNSSTGNPNADTANNTTTLPPHYSSPTDITSTPNTDENSYAIEIYCSTALSVLNTISIPFFLLLSMFHKPDPYIATQMQRQIAPRSGGSSSFESASSDPSRSTPSSSASLRTILFQTPSTSLPFSTPPNLASFTPQYQNNTLFSVLLNTKHALLHIPPILHYPQLPNRILVPHQSQPTPTPLQPPQPQSQSQHSSQISQTLSSQSAIFQSSGHPQQRIEPPKPQRAIPALYRRQPPANTSSVTTITSTQLVATVPSNVNNSNSTTSTISPINTTTTPTSTPSLISVPTTHASLALIPTPGQRTVESPNLPHSLYSHPVLQHHRFFASVLQHTLYLLNQHLKQSFPPQSTSSRASSSSSTSTSSSSTALYDMISSLHNEFIDNAAVWGRYDHVTSLQANQALKGIVIEEEGEDADHLPSSVVGNLGSSQSENSQHSQSQIQSQPKPPQQQQQQQQQHSNKHSTDIINKNLAHLDDIDLENDPFASDWD